MLYFVYELVDPRTNAIAYVGITDNPNQRFQAHLSNTKTNDGKRTWIERLQSEGLEPCIRILEVVETRQKALEREKYWIQHYIKLGEQLTNIHHGKERPGTARFSGPGYYCSEEEIAEELNLRARRIVVNWDGSD